MVDKPYRAAGWFYAGESDGSNWHSETNRTARINDNPGLNIGDTDHMSMVFRVRDGRIQDAPSDLRNYVGMRLDAFLEELRSGTRRSDVRER